MNLTTSNNPRRISGAVMGLVALQDLSDSDLLAYIANWQPGTREWTRASAEFMERQTGETGQRRWVATAISIVVLGMSLAACLYWIAEMR